MITTRTSLKSLSFKIAIIGTREPDQIQRHMAKQAAKIVVEKGGRVATGFADGIDMAAVEVAGPMGKCDIYLPWRRYNKEKYSKDLIAEGCSVIVYDPEVHFKWRSSVFHFHPAPKKLKRGAFACHARNFGIVSGSTAVCAFPNKTGGGGTGQGIRIARALNIPCLVIPTGSIKDKATGLKEIENFLVTVQGKTFSKREKNN